MGGGKDTGLHLQFIAHYSCYKLATYTYINSSCTCGENEGSQDLYLDQRLHLIIPCNINNANCAIP